MSGPGDRTPKRSTSWEPTQSEHADGHDAAPTRVDVESAFPPGSKEFGKLRKSLARESGELDGASPSMVSGRQPWEGDEPQATGHAVENSDAGMVPKKSAKTRVTPVESMEGRAAAEGKSALGNALRTQDRASAPTQIERIGQRARERKGERLNNLLSALKAPLLKEAYQRLRKDAASGVDEVTWEEYGEHLDARL